MHSHDAIVVRLAEPDDVSAMHAIALQCLPDPWSQASLLGGVRDVGSIALVVGDPGALSGYGVAWMIGDEAEIAQVAVRPAQRGSGLGTAIVRELIAHCSQRGARRLYLEVRRGNTAAQRLYLRLGFVETGMRPAYYANGEDAVTMTWKG